MPKDYFEDSGLDGDLCDWPPSVTDFFSEGELSAYLRGAPLPQEQLPPDVLVGFARRIEQALMACGNDTLFYKVTGFVEDRVEIVFRVLEEGGRTLPTTSHSRDEPDVLAAENKWVPPGQFSAGTLDAASI